MGLAPRRPSEPARPQDKGDVYERPRKSDNRRIPEDDYKRPRESEDRRPQDGDYKKPNMEYEPKNVASQNTNPELRYYQPDNGQRRDPGSNIDSARPDSNKVWSDKGGFPQPSGHSGNGVSPDYSGDDAKEEDGEKKVKDKDNGRVKDKKKEEADKVSFSPIFYEQIFHMKVFCTPFLCLQFGFVIFRQKEIGIKSCL